MEAFYLYSGFLKNTYCARPVSELTKDTLAGMHLPVGCPSLTTLPQSRLLFDLQHYLAHLVF